MAGAIALIFVLILAAMILLMLEVLTPTFGVLGALALGGMGYAVYLAFTQLSPAVGWVLTIVLIVCLPFYLILLVKWLPHTPLGRRVFLRKVRAQEGEGTPEAEKLEALVGKTGTTETVLRPSGAVRIDKQRVIALAESGMIEKGRKVKVIEAAGTNVVVRDIEPQQDNL